MYVVEGAVDVDGNECESSDFAEDDRVLVMCMTDVEAFPIIERLLICCAG